MPISEIMKDKMEDIREQKIQTNNEYKFKKIQTFFYGDKSVLVIVGIIEKVTYIEIRSLEGKDILKKEIDIHGGSLMNMENIVTQRLDCIYFMDFKGLTKDGNIYVHKFNICTHDYEKKEVKTRQELSDHIEDIEVEA